MERPSSTPIRISRKIMLFSYLEFDIWTKSISEFQGIICKIKMNSSPLPMYDQYSVYVYLICKSRRWKRFNLSTGGKMALCNAVLANLPVYCY